MRVRKNTNNSTTVRSPSNGPINRLFYLDQKPSDDGVKLEPVYYSGAKPYTSATVFDDVGNHLLAEIDGEETLLTAPSPSSILAASSEIDLDGLLNDVYSLRNSLLIDRAYQNTVLYGELLLYVSAKEAKATVDMVVNIFTRLFAALSNIVRKAKRLNLLGTLDELSSLWLEYRYGWTPLTYEIKAVNKLLNSPRVGRFHTARGLDYFVPPSYTGCFQQEVKTDKYRWLYEVRFTPDTIRQRYSYLFYNTNTSRNDSLLAKLGLDFDSLLSTGWELIPFSFVVDMFLNIGSLLQSRTVPFDIVSFNHSRSIVGTGQFEFVLKELRSNIQGGFIQPTYVTDGISWQFRSQEFTSWLSADPNRYQLSYISDYGWTNSTSNRIYPPCRLESIFYFPSASQKRVFVDLREFLNEQLSYSSTYGWSVSDRVKHLTPGISPGFDQVVGTGFLTVLANSIYHAGTWRKFTQDQRLSLINVICSVVFPADPYWSDQLFSTIPNQDGLNERRVLDLAFGYSSAVSPEIKILRSSSMVREGNLFLRRPHKLNDLKLEGDTDLTSNQMVDLVALAYSMGRGLISK